MTKRWYLLSSLLLTGCLLTPATTYRGALILKPQITPGGYNAQTIITPYTQASIHHLDLKLFTFNGSEHDLGIAKTLYSADLGNSVTFSNLRAGLTYRIKALAYSSASVLISTTDANSYTDVTLTNDDHPTLAPLKVKLIDQPFNGQGTASGITVTNGGYTLPPTEQLTTYQSVVTTLAGSTQGTLDGQGTSAQFNRPDCVAVDSAGNVYVTEWNTHLIRKITNTGLVSTLAGGASGFANGQGTLAQFNKPIGIAVDNAGNVYVAERANHQIRKITSTGMVSTLAGGAGGTIGGYADGPSTSALFNWPSGVGVDNAGNVYVADTNNNLIRKISTAGVVSTVAGGAGTITYGTQDGTGTAALFRNPKAVVADAAGNLYVSDSTNNRIRKISSTGVVTTIAGSSAGNADGIGTTALFNGPFGIAVDGGGNIYVADTMNQRIRKITTSGWTFTFSGSTSGFADGTGTVALYASPNGIAVDSAGNVYVGDSDNDRVRIIKQELITTP